MKKRSGGKALGRATLMMACGLFAMSAASGQVLKGSEPVTNEDVVQMVHQGASESAIIAAIRANPARFDLSLDKMLALHRQGVSTHVLNAMAIARMREHKAGGEKNADGLSPQPYPPKSRTNGTLLNSGGQQTLLGTGANSPSGDGSKSALVPVVQQPAITDGNVGDGSMRPGASGMPAAQTSALNGTGKTAITAGQTAVMAPAMMQKTSPGTIGPGQTMSATGVASPATRVLTPEAETTVPSSRSASSPPSVTSLATVAQVPSEVNLPVAEECAKDPTQRIISISSSAQSYAGPRSAKMQRIAAPLIFRPGPQYTIWGCSLSSLNVQNGGVVFLNAPGPFPGALGGLGGLTNPWLYFMLTLDCQSWTDNAIVVSVSLDPGDLEWLRANGYAASDGVDIKLLVQNTVTYQVVAIDGFGFSTYGQQPSPPATTGTTPAMAAKAAIMVGASSATTPVANTSVCPDSTKPHVLSIVDSTTFAAPNAIEWNASYEIHGCGFGQNEGSLYVSGIPKPPAYCISGTSGPFSAKFSIRSWSDTVIDFSFDGNVMNQLENSGQCIYAHGGNAGLTVYRTDKASTVVPIWFVPN